MRPLSMSPLRKTLLLVVSGVLLLIGGIWLGGHPEALPGPVRDAFVDEDRALRAEIIDDVKDNFYKPVSDKQIEESSLKGIVDGLNDRFSSYLTPRRPSSSRSRSRAGSRAWAWPSTRTSAACA